MSRSLAILLLLSLTLVGCRTLGEMIEGINSDQQRGAGYCQTPERDPDGNFYVPEREWPAVPRQIR